MLITDSKHYNKGWQLCQLRKVFMEDYHLGMLAVLIAPKDPVLAWELAEHCDDKEAFLAGAQDMDARLGGIE